MIEQAVILAGGEGTRLRPVTYEIPKPLIPVQGKPILTWQVEWLARAGVRHILVSISPRWQSAFETWLANFSTAPARIEFFVETEPMGTMGALVHHVSSALSGPTFITNGDELKGLDLGVLETFHRRERAGSPSYGATIALVRVTNPSDYGVAELSGTRIARFHEKPAHPPSNLVSSGLYIVEPDAFERADREKKFLMFEKDLFPRLAAADGLGGCPLDGPWYDCGTLERWEKAIKEWSATA